MKRQKKMISSALILGALLWMSTMPITHGQPAGKSLRADSGVVRLGAGQILRLTVNGLNGNDTLTVRFRRMYYTGTANGGVWKSSIMAEDMSGPTTIAPNEAASTDAGQGGFDGVRIEAIIRGYTGTTHVNTGVLQIINADGSVVVF